MVVSNGIHTCILVHVQQVKIGMELNVLMCVIMDINILLINVLLIAVATAFVGIISFVGLIIPHILRMISGSDNRNLIINSAILGAIFLSIADLIARILLKPAELPIGIITSWVGVPILIYLIRRKKYLF